MLRTELESYLSTGKPLRDMRYLKPVQVPLCYPISRATVYELLASGDIKSVLLKKKHGLRVTRLIDVQSIEDFLSKLAKEQEGKAFVPCIAEQDRPSSAGRRTSDAGSNARALPRNAILNHGFELHE